MIRATVKGTEGVRATFAALRTQLAGQALAATAENAEDYIATEAARHNRTGALVRSIFIRRVGADWEVGHDPQHAPHALFVLWGTKPHVIRPKKKRALRWPAGGVFAFARQVNHPGNKADPWLDRAAARAPVDFERHVAARMAQLNKGA